MQKRFPHDKMKANYRVKRREMKGNREISMKKSKKKKSGRLLLVLAVLLAAAGIAAAVRAALIRGKLTKGAESALHPTVDFVQPGMLADFDDKAYESYFSALKEAGYDSLILQFTRYKLGGVCYCCYPSQGLGSLYETVDRSMENVLGELLSQAERYGFKVWVGLSVDDDDWWGVSCYFDEAWMQRLGEADCLMVREISELYGDEPAFCGWYWAHELYSNPARFEKIWARLINSCLDTVNACGDGRPLMLSPFRHVQVGLVTNEYRMWKRFFRDVDFRAGDIFAPQDSFGKQNQLHPEKPSALSYLFIYDYLNGVKRAVDEEDGLSLWVNVELFQKENGDEYNPASAERVKLQLANASRVSDTLVSFSFSHYAYADGTNGSSEGRDALREGIFGR